MKYPALALVMLLALSANKCANKEGDDTTSLKDTRWVFQSLGGGAISMPEGVEMPWLKLEGEQLRGFGGCNQLMGSYTLQGDRLSFPAVGSTKMYCEATQSTENAIKEALGKVDSFEVKDGTLKLMGTGLEVATLVPGTEPQP